MTTLTGLFIVVGVLAIYVALCFAQDIWGLQLRRSSRQRAGR